jgi:large subunit ribosomal protein L19
MYWCEIIKKIQKKQLKYGLPSLGLGDIVCLGILIQEGNKQRIQTYQGTLISKKYAGRNSTITVRRVSQGVGVERVFFLHSPSLQRLEIRRRNKVRRAKLYYLRNLVGKATRLQERFTKNFETSNLFLKFFKTVFLRF